MPVLDFVLSVTVILAVAYVFGVLARALHLPTVIGHMVAGIALSASVIGALPGDPTATLLPLDARHSVRLVAEFGLILFVFCLGADVDRGELRRQPKAVPMVASATFAVPLLLGAVFALGVDGWYKPAGIPATAFVLYVAVALAISALPVLAAIVRERKLTESAPAAIALMSAVLIDAAAWLVLAAALFAADAGGTSWGRNLGLLAVFGAVMMLIVRPALNAWRPASSFLGIAVTTALAVGAGWVTTQLGLHAILGAFFAGFVFPRTAALRGLIAPLRRAGTFLLPVFLVLAGLKTDVGGLDARDFATLPLILTLAVAGKIGAGWAAARVAGLNGRDAATIGVLLNTRGVTELVVLSIGLGAGILEPRLYTVFVLMALLTSGATGPLLSAVDRIARRVPSHRLLGGPVVGPGDQVERAGRYSEAGG
jgi:Kef-type K+ transport system membrane component KefB